MAKVIVNSDNNPKQWKFETGDSVFSSSCMGPDGTVYVGSLDINYMQ